MRLRLSAPEILEATRLLWSGGPALLLLIAKAQFCIS